jgi:hypothetical protein
MRALTVCQPYAELIASGVKLVENRRWSTHYRGPLAIHAGASRAMLADWDGDPDRLQYGAIIAVVTLVGCVELEQLPARLVGHKHAHGPWCWLLKDARRLTTPVRVSGRLGLWSVPDAFVAGVGALEVEASDVGVPGGPPPRAGGRRAESPQFTEGH